LSLKDQPPAVGHRIAGIYTKIQQRLLDLIFIGHYRWKIQFQCRAQFDRLGKSLADQCDQFFD
jgi:hypothetical protein